MTHTLSLTLLTCAGNWRWTARFMSKGAASVTIVTLFDKPERRAKPIKADYIGFTVPN